MASHKPITVAFCIPNMIIGGVETVLKTTIDALLQQKNVQVVIITHAKIRQPLYVKWLASHPEIPVRVYYPLQNWFEDLVPYCRGVLKPVRKVCFSLYKKYRRMLANIFNRFSDIDVFIDYKNFEFFKEFKDIRKPKIAWVHSAMSHCEKNNLFSRLSVYNRLVCITDEFLNEFKIKYASRANDALRIYNPVNPDEIQKLALQGPRSSERYFCHVSRLTNGKDLKTVFDAFDTFAANHDDIKLFVIGDGPDAPALKTYAGTLKSAARIVFFGALDNPFGLMQGALANILSSLHEGFGMVLAESMALSSLVISSDYKCGATEILENGQNGFVFDIGNSAQLAQCMSDAICVEKKEQIIARAYKSLSRFSVQQTTKQIINLLQSVGGNK